MSQVPSLYPALRSLVDPEQVLMLSKATLVDVSHAIEDIVLEDRLEAAVFTGFQKSTHWEQEVARYREIAQVARNVCIFARGDLALAESIHCSGVTLATADDLSQEWFLLVLTREISVVLCGKDCHAPVSEEGERFFETIWTFDPAEITGCLKVIEWAVEHYRPDILARIQADFREFAPVVPNPRYVTRFVRRMARSQERANERLREANATLEERVQDRILALQRAMEERETVFTQLQDLVYTIAHDVRTPLIATELVLRRAVQGFYGVPPEALRSLLEDIRRSDRQLIDLSDNLLHIARLETGVEELEIERVALASLLRQVVHDMGVMADEKAVRQELALTPVVVRGNSAALRRVFVNLMDNAIKFSPVGGCIQISLTCEAGMARIAFQDEGPGMELEEQQQLFERFWQGKKRQLGRGTGLGLYLSSRLVVAQGGRIEVDSTPGLGSTFRIVLPISEEPV